MTDYTDVHAKAGIDAPLPAIDTWSNQYADYEISVEIPEYNAICPKTELPDFGHLTIRYVQAPPGEASKPGTDIDLFNAFSGKDYADGASFLRAELTDAMPADWLPPGVDAEVDAEVVEGAPREVGRAGQVSLGQFGPEAGGVDEGAGGDVVGVGVVPVRRKDELRADLPQHAGETVSGVEVGHERAVGQAEVAAPVEAKDRGGGVRLALPYLRAAVRRRLAVGQVEDADRAPLSFE